MTERTRGMELTVKLQVFEGPLDLLLYLLEKNKVNIYDIPIVEITEQYMEYIREMKRQDLEVLSEFLVMAATLVDIKSRMLLPSNPDSEEEEEDPRAELVQQLLEYKMYKYASLELKDMNLDAGKNYYKPATIPKEVLEYKEEIDPAEVIGDVTLAKLNEIFTQMMKRTVDRVDHVRRHFIKINKDEVRIDDKMDDIRASIRGLKGINFKTLLEIQATKINIIVTFMAILELMKVGDITIRQDELFGDIIIDSLEA